MTEKHDVFVRAYAIPKKQDDSNQTEQKLKSPASNLPKWPPFALIIDTETRITADQSLTFGVFRFCEL